jgi:hypothetical protein
VYKGGVQCSSEEMWVGVQRRVAMWRRNKRVYKAKLLCGLSGGKDEVWKICRTV